MELTPGDLCPTISLIGAGNTISSGNPVIDNRGTITAIDSGSGEGVVTTTVTCLDVSGNNSLYTIQNQLGSQLTLHKENGEESGQTYGAPAFIGTIKNIIVNAKANAVYNGYDGTNATDYGGKAIIHEIGEGTELCNRESGSLIVNKNDKYQIETVTGGIFTSIYFTINNSAASSPCTISGGYFKRTTGDSTALFYPNNSDRYVFAGALTGNQTVTLHDGTSATGYYTFLSGRLTDANITICLNDGVEGISYEITDSEGGVFTVTCPNACVVAWLDTAAGSYERMTAAEVAGAENTYKFTCPTDFAEDIAIVIAIKGDLNGDGECASNDASRAATIAVRDGEGYSVLDILLADVTGDGEVNSMDASKTASVAVGNTSLDW